MFQTNLGEKIKTLLFSIFFFFFEKLRLWGNVEKYRRLKSPQVTKWCMRIAYWITKPIKKHSEYVTLIAFLWQKWSH